MSNSTKATAEGTIVPTTTEPSRNEAHPEMLTRHWTNAVTDLLIDLHEVRERLNDGGADDFEDIAPLVDRALSRSYADSEALLRFAQTLAPSRYDRTDVLTELMRWSPSTAQAVAAGQENRSARYLMCDIKQVIACLEMICGTIDRQSAGGFRLGWLQEETAPSITVQASQDARFADSVTVKGGLQVSWERMRESWTAATNGGDINRSSTDTLILALQGDRTVPAGQPQYERVRVAMTAIVFALRPWRGAYGAADAGYVAASEGLRLYKKQVNDAIASAEAAHESLESDPTTT
jgi:hypothetical protein